MLTLHVCSFRILLLLLLVSNLSIQFAQAIPSASIAPRQVETGAPTGPARPFQTFKTEEFLPQDMAITKSGETEKGYLFLNPQGPGAEEAAPLIMTDDNELVWQGPAGLALGLRSQTYEGRPVLAYWNGSGFPDTLGRGYGAVTILDDSYEVIHLTLNESNDQKFVTFNGLTYPSYIDTKETFITDRNTMLVIATNITQTDLRSMGGAEDDWVVDDLIYEMDIKTNTVLFRWSFLEHIADFPLNRSLFPFAGWGMNSSTAWNYSHMNSFAAVGDHYVVSSRYFCTVFFLDAAGNVIWRLQVNHFSLSSPHLSTNHLLQGRDGWDFTLGLSTNFCYQHDTRLELPPLPPIHPQPHPYPHPPQQRQHPPGQRPLPQPRLLPGARLLPTPAECPRPAWPRRRPDNRRVRLPRLCRHDCAFRRGYQSRELPRFSRRVGWLAEDETEGCGV
jgi:hypothetical protein